MTTELVLKLRATGQQDVHKALQDLGAAAEQAGVKLTPLNEANKQLSEVTRVSTRAMGNLSQTLSGTAALLSIVARENKPLQDSLEKVTVAFSLASTAMSVAANAASLATIKLSTLRAALLALGTAGAGPIGLVIGGFAALLAVLEALDKKWHIASDRPAGAVQFMAYQAMKARELAAELEKAGQSIYRFSAAMGGRTGSFSNADIIAANEAIAKHNKEQERVATAAAKAARATRELAAAQLQSRQEIENETNELLLADAAMRQADEAARQLAKGLVGLAFDARDAAGRLSKTAEAAEDLGEVVERALDPLMRYRALILDARDAGMSLGRSTAASAREAQTAIDALPPGLMTVEQALERAKVKGLELWFSFKTGLEDMEIGLGKTDLGFGRLATASEKVGAAMKTAFGDAFANILTGAQSFNDALLNIINSILGAIGQHIGQAIFGKLFPGLVTRQHGGPLEAFQPAIVGERGPELFLPQTSGHIIPNHALGSPTFNYYIDARGAERGVEQRILRALEQSEDRAVKRAEANIIDAWGRGGGFRTRLR